MNSLALLKILVNQLEIYEAVESDKENLSLDKFIASMQQSVSLESFQNNLIDNTPKNPQSRALSIERIIAQHFLILFRYIKFYSKIAFADLPIKTLDEFSILATTLQNGSITKTDLIKKNILEKSSGIEIIKRLLKAGYLVQTDNPEDQRSQLISLSEAGRNVLFSTFGKMETLGIIASGELNKIEKEQLIILLKKLDNFHFDNYHNKANESLEDYLPSE